MVKILYITPSNSNIYDENLDGTDGFVYLNFKNKKKYIFINFFSGNYNEENIEVEIVDTIIHELIHLLDKDFTEKQTYNATYSLMKHITKEY